MNGRHRVALTGLLLAGCAALAAIPEASARRYTGAEDLSLAWQRYLVHDAGREPSMSFPYEECFRQAAAAHDVPVSLLLALARGESDFDADARSHANAHGLMQILWPTTAQHLGVTRLSTLYEPCVNVDAGTRYLKELLARYNGDLHLSLAAYNYGPQRIKSDGRGIPSGAEWYSGYIYRHLQYVLGQGASAPRSGGVHAYAADGKLELASFGAPYRAEAFVALLQGAAPELRLDWFRAGAGRFRVSLLYDSPGDLERSKALLARAGFPVK